MRLGATFSDEGGRKGWAVEVWRVEPREKGALCDWVSRMGGCVGQLEVDIELREGGLARKS